MIYIASDHGGFVLKESVREFLVSKNLDFQDLGAHKLDPLDDYPDFAKKVAEKISQKSSDKGILLCRNGVGVSIVANRYPGVRAVLGHDVRIVRTARNDDDANVLCMGADYIDAGQATDLTEVFLNSNFSADPRFLRRLSKIKDIEDAL